MTRQENSFLQYIHFYWTFLARTVLILLHPVHLILVYSKSQCLSNLKWIRPVNFCPPTYSDSVNPTLSVALLDVAVPGNRAPAPRCGPSLAIVLRLPGVAHPWQSCSGSPVWPIRGNRSPASLVWPIPGNRAPAPRCGPSLAIVLWLPGVAHPRQSCFGSPVWPIPGNRITRAAHTSGHISQPSPPWALLLFATTPEGPWN
jgi:hypothetical protein